MTVTLFKPTKIKFLATLVIYASFLISGWIGTGLGVLLIPQMLQPETMQFVSEFKESMDLSFIVVFVWPIASFLLRILLFYIAACLILNMPQKDKNEITEVTSEKV